MPTQEFPTKEANMRKTDCPAALSPMEAARILGVGRSTIYRLIEQGDVPSVRFGRKLIRVPRAALEKMLQAAAEGK